MRSRRCKDYINNFAHLLIRHKKMRNEMSGETVNSFLIFLVMSLLTYDVEEELVYERAVVEFGVE